ncbi:unnamed protein product [Rotaria magnacalcarata]|uniref:Uncharacterized protein n=1 Tax=Rotaria magnacalcarata TaxID=392030 RepID=A0A816YU64_9BILA|nr:unnamed protein product [Rotaria magnacalcarata]CAF2162688.1 unnamed protein product [Rotaria magnacalcarata]CAF3807064.1 unnamed protein product [Rotaria magnacalcarata]CAF3821372.1 unnamed protein product [Rotaria magnacalcarata]CAF3827019.1 unnamed protein product [Rotaria magnacalcarata]
MVRYTIMKRFTKIFASILFIISVVTIYLAFDFAITNALSTKQHSTDKYKTESPLSLMKIKNTNETLKHNNDNQPSHTIIKLDRPVRSLKDKQRLVKPAQFHKSKTGIKLHQMKKSSKNQRKKLATTKIVQHKEAKLAK